MLAALLALLAASAAAAQSAAGADPTTPAAAASAWKNSSTSSSSAPAGPWTPSPYHTTRYSFLSPNVVFYPPGGWVTNQHATFANTTGNVSVSVELAGSGAVFSGSQLGTLLVNGSSAEHWNGTTNITERSAEVSGLAYGWWNFTLVGSGAVSSFESGAAQATLSFTGASGVTNGSQWLPALNADRARVDNATGIAALGLDIQTSGTWTNDHRRTTQTPGSELVIKPRKGTAVLELNQDVPDTPFGAFNVTISPPPPFGPASEAFSPTLRSAEVQFAIAQMDVLVYAVQLDPDVEYTVRVAYAGNGTDKFSFSSVGAYASSIYHVGPGGSPEKSNGTGKQNTAGKPVYLDASVPWTVVPFLAAGLWLVM
ncbi:Multiple RNA-binding domain-containing protein 1 [Vanrija albida]|uniref:Multiple RNA-binding domain-containing protein 1 n=1 Tax=Vanrija albida TaxID=181172 RepID=A0ABR3PRI1_9TREE